MNKMGVITIFIDNAKHTRFKIKYTDYRLL